MGGTRRCTIADVKRNYSLDKAREESFGDWASALIYRPLSFVVTPPLIRLGISATAVTVFSLMLGLSLPFIASLDPPVDYIAIAALAIVWGILDCVDGNIARTTGTTSMFGHYLDSVTDVVFQASFYCAIGLLANREGGQWLFSGASNLALAVLAGYIALIARFSRLFQELHFGHDIYGVDSSNLAIRNSNAIRNVFSFLSGVDRLLPLMVLAAGFLARMDWVVRFMLIYATLDLIYTQYLILHRLREA